MLPDRQLGSDVLTGSAAISAETPVESARLIDAIVTDESTTGPVGQTGSKDAAAPSNSTTTAIDHVTTSTIGVVLGFALDIATPIATDRHDPGPWRNIRRGLKAMRQLWEIELERWR